MIDELLLGQLLQPPERLLSADGSNGVGLAYSAGQAVLAQAAELPPRLIDLLTDMLGALDEWEIDFPINYVRK